MPLVKNLNVYRKKDFGTVVLVSLKFPFFFFSRKPVTVFFQPDLPNAGWYEIGLEVYADEEFYEKEGGLAVMAYLRSKHNDLAERMVKFPSP